MWLGHPQGARAGCLGRSTECVAGLPTPPSEPAELDPNCRTALGRAAGAGTHLEPPSPDAVQSRSAGSQGLGLLEWPWRGRRQFDPREGVRTPLSLQAPPIRMAGRRDVQQQLHPGLKVAVPEAALGPAEHAPWAAPRGPAAWAPLPARGRSPLQRRAANRWSLGSAPRAPPAGPTPSASNYVYAKHY